MTLAFMHRMLQPDTYPSSAAAKAPDVLSTWLRYSPASQPEDRDWEDWFENAVMLHEAHKICGDVRILDNVSRIHMLGDNSPLVAANPTGIPTFMYGMFRSGDRLEFPKDVNLVGNNADSVSLVQDYAHCPIFLKAAGREFHVAGGDSDEIVEFLTELHAAGHRKAFLKTRHKEFARVIELPEDPRQIRQAAIIDTELCWTLLQYEGRKNAFYVQEAFEPTREYRMIIVGHEPVTGAGCVEAFTPLDNLGTAFDPQMEPLRNRSEVVTDHVACRRYVEFARTFASEWAAAHGDHHCYSLDLAIDGRNGAVVAIEMNPLLNLGLYASNAGRLVDAIYKRFS